MFNNYKIFPIIVLATFCILNGSQKSWSGPCDFSATLCFNSKRQGENFQEYCNDFSDVFKTKIKKKIEKYKDMNETLVSSWKTVAQECLKSQIVGVALKCAREACESTQKKCLTMQEDLKK